MRCGSTGADGVFVGAKRIGFGPLGALRCRSFSALMAFISSNVESRTPMRDNSALRLRMCSASFAPSSTSTSVTVV